MLAALRTHHERIRECLLLHRALCAQAAPDSGRLALSRLRLSAVNADRSRFLANDVLPLLQSRGDPGTARVIHHLATDLATRQVAAKEYISRWDVMSIERDWDGYKQASARALMSIEQRIRLEVDVLIPILINPVDPRRSV
jgi:hypothetical protein